MSEEIGVGSTDRCVVNDQGAHPSMPIPLDSISCHTFRGDPAMYCSTYPYQMMACLLIGFSVTGVRQADAHCEVPCGIYGDQARFVEMLENTKTIAKAIDSLQELAKDHSPQVINQAIRWVTTKEEHATATQHIIAQYFMTQRIKADNPAYTKQLTAAHAVMVAAMKCKQQADGATADSLREAILSFYTAYTGKEPDLHTHD
ncbi:MAG: superoxide dismutase, Ni [Gammaproteobacteria bacterium]|nr:superoxide dismutase, Ni [Gammaproteobacteria bacterium]